MDHRPNGYGGSDTGYAEDTVILEGDNITGQCLPGEPFSPPQTPQTPTLQSPQASCAPTQTAWQYVCCRTWGDDGGSAGQEIFTVEKGHCHWFDGYGMVTPTIEALEGDIFELREENKILKERFDKQVRDREKEVERENIVSAKVRSVENEQYARRYNM